MKAVWQALSVILVVMALFFSEQASDRTPLEHAFSTDFASQLQSHYKHSEALPELQLNQAASQHFFVDLPDFSDELHTLSLAPLVNPTNPALFLYPSQINPIYWLVIEFFIWVFSLVAMLNLISHKPIALWFIHIYSSAKSRISGWQESNLQYCGCNRHFA